MRNYRKREHIENYLRSSFRGDPLFDDVFLYHNALPGVNFEAVDTTVDFLGRTIAFPLMINAMTGGTDFSTDINTNLAELAKAFNIPMAVGSMTIAMEDDDAKKSFKTVRDTIGDGILIGNLSGYTGVDTAKYCVDLIGADALQIHLNPAQELAMNEGERDFSSVLKNLEAVIGAVDVPVIVKEVGFGLSPDTITRLYDIGVRNVDIAGFGGSNFFEVENLRTPDTDVSDLYSWGIPTAMSLIEAVKVRQDGLYIIASGGVRNALDVVKCLVLGGDLVGISGEVLSYLIHGGYDYTLSYLRELMTKARMVMALSGASNVAALKGLPYRVKGDLKDLLDKIY
ncbi:type 2 isopentenyl-diphosphate Delta-isomerase [Peptoniphilus equinus]|uniref:Isopentenyl-diphosphate delta-isomerase n=1 Tax=Peptoniphilus equinus TaxID=3016343 RepID=A0ABY7QWF4_9FIRM|nr:type 2 isopentenyl-diphosphate Delta-isomerase [Peptoniphilus equinus]WBW50429.1 type 2 isopentenyl-diphosphate Delta-isomerase [Peptoniphilus equinus]